MIESHEVSEPIKDAIDVVQGDTNKLPKVMERTGSLLLKMRNRLSTTQMALAVGALAVGLVLVTKKIADKRQFAM